MDNQLLVVFGGTGDLAHKKILPALRKLYEQGTDQPVLLVGRSDIDIHEYIQKMGIEDFNDEFLENLYYLSLNVKTGDPEVLRDKIESVSDEYGCKDSYTFYLALPYFLFTYTSSLINDAGLNTGDSKIALEKPFGKNLETARRIHEELQGFDEDQIFRVDHYLGKELVENILALRFSNPLFQSIWSHNSVKNIQITMSEDMGVEGRTGYYDEAGAIRDVFQNHLLQVLSLTAMREPDSLSPEKIRDEKLNILKNINPVDQKDIVLGQYGGDENCEVTGYRDLEGVEYDSDTETFFALKLSLDIEKWRGVPFYLRSGKRMKDKFAEINIVLEDDSELFSSSGSKGNILSIEIQPYSGVSLRFNSKKLDDLYTLEPQVMEYCESCRQKLPGAYKHIIEELMRGDKTMFVDWDVMKESWKVTDSMVETARSKATQFPNYTPGSNGPTESKELIENGNWVDFSEKRSKNTKGDFN